MSAAHILVTGGAGFIGSHLVDGLRAVGHTVRVYDDFSTGRRDNLAHVAAPIEIVEGDVRDLDGLRGAMDGCDAVAHLAAVASVADSYARFDEVDSINVGGTVKALRAARERGLRRLVFASSCAVYGDAAQLPIGESGATAPLSPYAVGKLAGEGYCRALAREAGESAADVTALDAVCLRFFNVYGPRQDPGSPYSGVISLFMAAAAGGGGITICGDGEQTRDFVYVGDVVRALIAALAGERRFDGEPINIGSGIESSVNELAAAVRRVSGAELPARAVPARAGDIRRSRADASRAADLLDWRASTSLEEGLAGSLAWTASQRGLQAFD